MIPNRILHPELAYALATLGHGDIVMVTDAGFPIPVGANRIDLGFYEGLPDVLDVLRVLRKEIFVEEIYFATDVRDRHPNLYKDLQEIYTGAGAPFRGTTHEQLVNHFAPKAKLIVRSGSFNAWANIAMIAATDPFAWFNQPGIKILPAYVERRRMMETNAVPELKD